ncbi:MAG: DUF3419 family protein, partial [Bdellovibrionales bacterium]|nr:DUF3419 family protein [Bdellovibrionales bacterium]
MERYFKGLNYSLANEDSSIERSLSRDAKQILAVCGSGGRAFSLIHDNLEELNIIDISAEQLEFAKFKYELIKICNYEDYLKIMGVISSDYYEIMELVKKSQISNEWLSYVKRIPENFLIKGIIYSGKWE